MAPTPPVTASTASATTGPSTSTPPRAPATAISAPGKVLLAGGYLVLDRAYTGLVFGLSARISVVASEIRPGVAGVQLSEVVVESPQFVGAVWRYGFRLVEQGGGVGVTELRAGSAGSEPKPNPFVETALTYALSYVSRVGRQTATHSMPPARLTILADNDYYSMPDDAASATNDPNQHGHGHGHEATAAAAPVGSGRFARYPHTLSSAHKTGLGSSAALVTALTAAVLTHYLPAYLFDVASDAGKQALHNLAQTAHCAAQGKVGSGFDVAAAVFGSSLYRRFSPAVLEDLPAPGAAGFAEALVNKVEDRAEGAGAGAAPLRPWDTEVRRDDVGLPPGVVLRMCDVDCGSQTVGMVKKVLEWRRAAPEESGALWDALQGRNDELARVLRGGKDGVSGIPAAVARVRELVREMGAKSGVPIEPESQTELLDALGEVGGVYGGVVPGAGGFDALAILTEEGEETARRLEGFLADWSLKKEAKVKLLEVKGEVEGVRAEGLDVYSGWLGEEK